MQLMYVQPPTGYTKPENEELTEYPKFVHFKNGRPSEIVNDAAEENALLAYREVPSPIPVTATGLIPEPVKTLEPQTSVASAPEAVPGDEKTLLIAEAEAKGVKIDKRWSAAKIKAALEAA